MVFFCFLLSTVSFMARVCMTNIMPFVYSVVDVIFVIL